ncbi:MAG TPA: Uma2 family endonuclease [Chthoniobacteraceae bacterium]|jgi:Uma2 family endonuclease|nr:Uma2 family endonuclease [Chthoniobacteraceae bacterium]
MSALAEITPFMTVEEYLATEEFAPRKREYLGGFVYEMAGASESHNRIASNLNRILGNHLLGGPCEYFGADMKLKVDLAKLSYFYYPDGMVACDPTEHGKDYRERPSLIVEITSESTKGIDAREKLMAYRQVASLEAYVRVEQLTPELLVERRTESGWQQWRFSGLDAVADFGVLGIKLPLRDVYDRVVFPT